MSLSIGINPFEDLANAIIFLACEDYKVAYQDNDPETMDDVEEFLKSEWFQTISNLDGNRLYRRLHYECKRVFKSGACN